MTPVRYHGSAMIVGDSWHVEADPEASIMLKRIFARIDKSELGQMKIRRTPEIDKLLQWFLDLMPLELTPDDARRLHGGAEEHRAQARRLGRILAHDYTPTTYTLAVQPRDYQRVAADAWLEMGSLLLADDTGVGKTGSAMTALSRPEMLPAGIVVPGNNLARQWRNQLQKWIPGIRVFLCVGTTARPPPGDWPDVVICPYHLLQHWADLLAPRLRCLVFDEVQDMRHTDTSKYKSGRALRAKVPFCLGLSATPSYGYGGQYFAVLDLIRPGCLGTEEEFEREWCIETDEKRKRRIRNPKALGLWLDRTGLRLRRTRKDVGRELPGLTMVPHAIEADVSVYNKHMHGAYELARTLLGQGAGKGAGLLKMKAAADMDQKMRQATGLAKAPYVAIFLRLLVESGERPVVFAHHHGVYDVLAAELKDLAPGFVTGRQTDRQKAESIARFTDRNHRTAKGEPDGTDILILGLRAQATGLDGLQYHSRTVVIAELDWEGRIHHQAISRVDRDGQTEPVTAYVLLAEEGSDPIVATVCGVKDSITGVISDPDMARASVPEVDANRAKLLAEAYLARNRGR